MAKLRSARHGSEMAWNSCVGNRVDKALHSEEKAKRGKE